MVPSSQLEKEFRSIDAYWSPRVVAQINDQFMKLAKIKGEFVWHTHNEEDELFIVHKGHLILKFRDREDVVLNPGDFYVVPKGVEHFPYAPEETWVILMEPVGTKHTGEVVTELTKSIEEQLMHFS